MKKFLAVLLAVTMVFGLSMVTLADTKSPVAEEFFDIKFVDGIGSNFFSKVVKQGGVMELEADPEKGEFSGWSFYLQDGSVAKKNTDYKIVSGDEKQIDIEIKPYVDLIVCANYDGKMTDPLTGKEKKPTNPKTGDFTYAYFVLMIGLAALSTVVVSKKQLQK